MNIDNNPFSEDILQSWVDNVLNEGMRQKVDEWLQDNPKEFRRLRDYKLQNDLLRGTYDGVLTETVPDRLKLENIRSHRRTPSAWYSGALAATLAFGLIGGWMANIVYTPVTSFQNMPVTNFSAQAIAAHQVYSVEVLHPVEVEASEEAHLVAWLSKRLGQPINAPSLVNFGYDLLGGRLLSEERGPAAQFMYENPEGRRLTLYVVKRPDGGDTAFRFQENDGIAAFYWIDGPMGYVLSGKLERDELLQVTTAVYQELSAELSSHTE